MVYVFNKNKIVSYLIASSFVLMLFAFHDNMIPNRDVEIMKVSSNVTENLNNNNNTLINNQQ